MLPCKISPCNQAAVLLGGRDLHGSGSWHHKLCRVQGAHARGEHVVGLGTQAARKPLPLLSGASTYLANNHARERHGVKGAGAGSVEYQNILYWQIMLQTV